MKKQTILFSLLFLTTFTGAAFAQNEGEERRLYEIYRDYHSKPTDAKVWSQLLEPLQTENYKIQYGDSLWSISELFFGDGNYWPKVWSVNSKIENPHLIEKGNEIRFRMGTMESEPSFYITEQNNYQPEYDTNVIAVSDNVSGQNATASGVDFIPSSYVPKPVLKNLPPSLPTWALSIEEQANDESWGLDVVPRPPLRVSNRSYLQSFVTEGPVEFVGKVVEPQREDELMVEDKIVYVELNGNHWSSGEKLLIVADAGPLVHQTKRRPKAHVIRISAELQLREPVTVRKPRKGFSYYKARVSKSLDVAVSGNKLLKHNLKSIDYDRIGRVSNTPVEILGGQLDANGFHFSSGNVVYLDQGSAQGVAEGDIFIIQKIKKESLMGERAMVEHTQLQAGQVQVVDVTGEYATAIVLKGAERVTPGDGSFN